MSGLRLFPHFLFRTTALPFGRLDRLACPEAAAQAGRVLAAEARRDELAAAFLQKVRAHVRGRTATPALSRAAERVRRLRPLSAEKLQGLREAGHAEEAATATAYNALTAEISHLSAEGEAVLRGELETSGRVLGELAADPRVREAVLLSSPGALDGLDRFRAEPGERASLGRLAVRYLQRLCAKNDTISFFGPMTWGRFDAASRDGLELQWRDPGLTSRHVFFEHWAAARLARAVEGDAGVRGRLRFRVRYPFEWSANGLSLHHPLAGRVPRPQAPPAAALLRALAGGLTAEEAVARAARELPAEPQAATAALEALLEQGVIEAFACPIEALHPVEDLREALREARGLGAPTEAWEGRLDELLDLKARFAEADLAGRREILAALEDRFHAWTGAPARRSGGKTYAGRGLLYEDCTRHPERFTIGGRVLADMERDLGSLLAVHSALLEVIEPYGWRRLEEIHAALGRGGRPVTLNKFLIKLSGLVGASYLDARLVREEDREAIVEQALSVLELRGDGAGRLHVAARDPDVVARAGLLARPVIPGVDLMIAARDAAAMDAGDYRFVVGEVQYFPLGYPEYLFTFHPDPEAFRADYRRVLAAPRATPLPLVRVELEREVTRLVRMAEPLAPYVLVDGHGRCFDARRPQRRITELTVELEDGRVVLVDTEGRRLLLGNPHHDLFLDAAFKLLGELQRREAAGGAAPELTVGERTVLLRRSWTVPTEALGPGTGAEGGGDRTRAPFSAFVGVQRLRAARALPRYLFARPAGEVKPVVVDLDSPLLVEGLARMCGAGQPITLAEMCPGPGELWLSSPEGRHTSELRLFLG